jgi:hypothetical protein
VGAVLDGPGGDQERVYGHRHGNRNWDRHGAGTGTERARAPGLARALEQAPAIEVRNQHVAAIYQAYPGHDVGGGGTWEQYEEPERTC